MKRLLIAVFAAFLCMCATAFAEVTLSIEPVCIKSDEAFTVPVYIEADEGIASYTINIQYDNTKLKPTALRQGEVLAGYFIPNLEYSENKIRAVYAGAMDTTPSGVLFYADFTAISEVDARSEIELIVEYMADVEYSDVPNNTSSAYASISVNEFLPFDIELTQGTAQVKNIAKESGEGVLYIAGYSDEGRLVNVQSDKISLGAQEEISCKYNATGKVKAFVMTNEMQPRSYVY